MTGAPRTYLCSRGRGFCVARCRKLWQVSRHRVDAKAQSFPERRHIVIRGGSRLQLLPIFVARVAPKASDDRCAGNLPADSLDRMSQGGSAAAEIEIGQADHHYAGTIEAR